MKSSTRSNFVEKGSRIGIDTSILDKPLRDSRTGLQLGTVRKVCSQYGVSIAIDGDVAVLSAPRDRMQPMAEKLHYCRIKYLIL